MTKPITALTDIRPQTANANQHTPRGMGELERSIQQDGWIGAITVAADGETFDGSARVEVGGVAFDGVEPIVVESDGSRPVVLVRKDIPSADDPRAKRLGVAANRVAALNLSWDASVLDSLIGEGIDLSTLFRDGELPIVVEDVEPGDGGDDFDTNPDLAPTRCQPGDLWQIGPHRLLVGDCTDPANVERLMGGERADALITDPPYGYNLTEWDASIDTVLWAGVWLPLSGGFYAVFGQMPSIHNWHCAALAQKAHFCEHVVWVKRIATPMHRLNRSHESIYIYALGERKMFYETTGRFEDVKLPGVLVDVVSLEGIDRHVKDLRRKTDGLPSGFHAKGRSNKFGGDGKKLNSGTPTDRSPEFANYTNVWSFLPPTQSTRDGIDDETHQTGKPVEVIERLVELLTPPGSVLVADPFLGSGTALIAAHRTGRRCYGMEISPRYCDVILRRAEAEGLTCERVIDA